MLVCSPSTRFRHRAAISRTACCMLAKVPYMRTRLRSAITRYSIRNRHRKATAISAFMDAEHVKTVLMVGAMSETAGPGAYANQGIVEREVARGRDIVMGINIEAPGGELGYPFTIADARNMPFRDGYVDFALANAIIEHVGDESDQRQFVEEHCRVARSWVITTPNKWFPVEAHTATVFAHWLPSWRRKRTEFTRLLSRREFRALLPEGAVLHGRPWSPTFTATYSRLGTPRSSQSVGVPSLGTGRMRTEPFG